MYKLNYTSFQSIALLLEKDANQIKNVGWNYSMQSHGASKVIFTFGKRAVHDS